MDEKHRGGDEVHSRRAEMEWAFADSSDQLSGLNSTPSLFELFARGGASVYDGNIGLCSKVRVCHMAFPPFLDVLWTNRDLIVA